MVSTPREGTRDRSTAGTTLSSTAGTPLNGLRQARALEAQLNRSEAPGIRRVLDALYMVLLLALIVGAPTWLALREGAQSATGLLALVGTMPPHALIFALTLPLAVLTFMLAPSLSPILGKPFDLHILSESPIERRATYGLRTTKTCVWLALALAALALLLWTLTTPALVLLLLGFLSSLAAAALIVAAWLAGQLVSPVTARVVSVAASCILLFTMLTMPASQLLNFFAIPPLATAVISLAAIAVAVPSIAKMLPLIRSQQVLSHAYLWQRLVNSAGIGDFTTARTELAISTSIGRKWPLPKRAGWWGTVAWLDLLSLARSPWRILWIVALNFVAVQLFATAPPLLLGPTQISIPLWAGGLAAVAQYFAFSCFSDRVRFAALMALPPRLFGGSSSRLIAAHLIVPVACSLVGTLVAALVIGSPSVLIWSLALLPIQCLTLVYTALKREPPLVLTIPVASPMGDSSSFNQLLWQFDFIAIIALAGILMYALVPASSTGALVTLTIFGLYLLAGIRRRFRRQT